MGNRRTMLAAAAIALAVIASLGVYFYASGADKRAEDKVKLVDAFVAATDIPKGTSGSAAAAGGLIVRTKVLAGSVPAAAVTDLSELDGKVAVSAIPARQYITGPSFVAPSEGGGGTLAASLGGPNVVAVTVSVDAPRAVANQIAPGDRVDLISLGGGSPAKPQYFLRNVKVLAVGQETAASAAGGNGQPSATAQSSGLITFEVSPEDALRIVQESSAGALYLTLLPITASTSGGTTTPAASAASGR